MKYSHLENRLKGLNHLESDIDTSEVWKQLEPKLYAKENSRKLFYFKIFGIGLFIITFLGTLIFSTSQYNSDQAKKILNTESEIVLVKDDELNNHTDLSIENIVDKNLSSSNLNRLNESNKTQGNIEEINDLNTNASDIMPNPENIIDKDQNVLFTNNFFKPKDPKHRSDNVVINKINSINVKDTDFSLIKIDYKQPQNQSNNAPNLKAQNSNLANLNHINSNSISSNSINSKSANLVFSQLTNRPLFTFKTASSKLLAPIPSVDNCPTFNKRNNKIYFSIRPYVDYDFPLNQIKSTEGDSKLAELRNRLETNFIAYSYGVELRARTRSGINVFTGINQSVVKDQFDYSIEKDTMILITDIIKDISINENQDSVVTFGDTLINARALETGRRFNRYTSIDIPIGFEFTKRFSKIEYGVSTTAFVNLNFATKGSLLNENEDYTTINGVYKNSVAIRMRLSTPIQYYLGKKVSLGVAPSFTYSPQSISKTTYSLEHKVNLFSIRVFADYSF